MCLLAIQYRLLKDSPVLVAANREEFFDRETLAPSIHPGKPRILAGTDALAGGTWLGVNQHGVFAAVCNRHRHLTPIAPRSRGLLCKEMLRCASAREAADLAYDELASGKYDGANYVVADRDSGWVLHHGDELEMLPLQEGMSIISSGDVNDPRDERVDTARRLLTLQTLDSPVKFLAVASKVFARPASAPGRPGMVVRRQTRGTVSSTLLALGKKPRDAIFQYADGPPDQAKYEDFSPLLRDILSRGLREARQKAAAQAPARS